ncbi:hypothetical protein TKK_0013722 [Trichogramma kaykai]
MYDGDHSIFEGFHQALEEIEIKYYTTDFYQALDARPEDPPRVRLPDLPVLIIGGRPVTRLFLFNIHSFKTRLELMELLSVARTSDFELKSHKRPRDNKSRKTMCSIHCKTLAASLRLQSAALTCMLDVGFYSAKENKFKPCYANIKPDKCYASLAHPVMFLRQNFSFSFESHLFIAYRPVLRSIYSGLKSDAALNLTFALCNHPLALEVLYTNHFDFAWPLFSLSAPYDFIETHFKRFLPHSITFNSQHYEYNYDICKRAIEKVYSVGCSRRESGVVALRTLDLSMIQTNHVLLSYIAERFVLDEFVLGETRSRCDSAIAGIIARKLEFRNTFWLRGTFLRNSKATEVKIVDCIQLSLQETANALRDNSTISSLLLHNALASDFAQNLAYFIEAIFSDLESLSRVTFTFKQPYYINSVNAPVFSFSECKKIQYLDITNAVFLNNSLHALLRHTPNLEHLILFNLEIIEPATFNHLLKLKILQISCVPNLKQVLDHIPSGNLKMLIIECSSVYPLGDLEIIVQILQKNIVVKLLNFALSKLPLWLYRLKSAGKITVEKNRNSVKFVPNY